MGTSIYGARPPSHTAYYVALGGIVLLLFLLCCYFFYFCVKRVKELSKDPDSITQPARAAPAPPAYPVHSAVRDSATAMAKLCKQLPQPTGKGGTVFPAATSPSHTHTRTHTHTHSGASPCPPHAPDAADKMPVSAGVRIDQGSVVAR